MNFWDFIFPPKCPICAALRLPWETRCCPICYSNLPYLGTDVCCRCGRPVEDTKEYCETCEKQPPAFDVGASLYHYKGTAKEALMNYKYRGEEWRGEFFAEELLRVHRYGILAMGWDGITGVPMHRSRLKKRGYNQAEVIGKILAKRLGIPYYSRLLVRRKKTIAMKQLGPTERLKNLLAAFAIRDGQKSPKRMLLVDDILTTGSTAEACSRLLRQAGAEEIGLLTICTAERE